MTREISETQTCLGAKKLTWDLKLVGENFEKGDEAKITIGLFSNWEILQYDVAVLCDYPDGFSYVEFEISDNYYCAFKEQFLCDIESRVINDWEKRTIHTEETLANKKAREARELC